MSLSRADVRKHLEELGYHQVSDELLDIFAQDLNEYVLNETQNSSDVTYIQNSSRCSTAPSQSNLSGISDVTNASRKRITKHRNGDVSVRESPRVTFDVSDSLSTLSLSTVGEDRPVRSRVWDEDAPLPSCIIPRPQTSSKKRDPIKSWKKYNVSWAHHQVPGEKRHTALRNAIRKQMLECDLAPFVAPQREVTVNRYEIPTSKKRERLRWAVRNKMMG